ncbi:CsbD family protein [Lactobacillus sp. ESL0791]|uniref:CsbD family protein n=1 Tax=Lactobacillus sp. ESL0791 TaxID=2983234 RepID=UPI0023F869DA|nr:CsbD family protein [Lactobacillus sp. ESL0791]MDF7637842.1 CsbD family protein [Lactobacillus sp. ESL0791]
MSEKMKNLKDKVVGKVKDAEGKVTGDKMREVEGKAQKAAGDVKDKFNKVKDNLKK